MSEQSQAVVPHYASVGMAAFGGGGSLPALQNMADVVSIAQLMAKSQVAVPKHLRDNPGACLAVTMQALRWEMEPFAVANKSYSVNDRLAYEAQLIAAVILTRSPIAEEPDYTFEGEGEDRVCTVSIKMLSGKTLTKSSPKFGKITPKNSPLWKSDPDQQQSYYTIRAWGRLHQPQVILGVYDREEMSEVAMKDVTPEKSGIMDRLSKAHGDDGFSDAAVAEIEEHAPKKRDPKPKAEKDPQEAPIEPEATDVAQEAETPATEALSDPDAVLDGDDLPEGLRARPTETANVQNADVGPGSSDSVTLASTGSQEEASSPEPSEPDVIAQGYPEAGEVYHLNGDEWGEDGRRDTYKDGLPFSSAKRETGHAIYEDHRPEGPGGMVSEPELATDEAPRDELDVYVDAVEAAKTWKEITDAMGILWATDFFKAKTLDQQNHIRATTWDYVTELPSRPDQADHPTAFRLWLETQDDPDAIEGTFRTLQNGAIWRETMKDGPKADITLAVKRRLETVKGE